MEVGREGGREEERGEADGGREREGGKRRMEEERERERQKEGGRRQAMVISRSSHLFRDKN